MASLLNESVRSGNMEAKSIRNTDSRVKLGEFFRKSIQKSILVSDIGTALNEWRVERIY